ncbi:hypothetical protein EJB05_31054, partial [Eragrostis curvula]
MPLGQSCFWFGKGLRAETFLTRLVEFPELAPEGDLIVKTHASENQIVKVEEISGSINDNMNDQMYASLQSIQKMRNDMVREHCMLGDQSAQRER